MTIQEAKYLLENTAWLAPSLEPIDEAIEMACDALDKVEYINSQLGKVEDEPTISKMEQVDEDEPQTDCYKCADFWNCDGQCDEVETDPQTERP